MYVQKCVCVCFDDTVLLSISSALHDCATKQNTSIILNTNIMDPNRRIQVIMNHLQQQSGSMVDDDMLSQGHTSGSTKGKKKFKPLPSMNGTDPTVGRNLPREHEKIKVR